VLFDSGSHVIDDNPAEIVDYVLRTFR